MMGDMDKLSETRTPRQRVDHNNFTWLNLGKGLVGCVVGGVIEGLGICASTVWRTPRMAGHTFKALWKTQTFGPVLRTTLMPAVLLSGLCAPVVALFGGLIHGMVVGFKEGANQPSTVPSIMLQNIQKFHNEQVDEAIQELHEWSMQKPERVYEIRVIEAVKGLMTGLVGGTLTGLGVCLSTAVNLLGIYFQGLQMIFGMGVLPLVVGALILWTAIILPVAVMVVIVGALGGLGIGAYRGYTKGILSAISGTFEDIKHYHDIAVKFAWNSRR